MSSKLTNLFPSAVVAAGLALSAPGAVLADHCKGQHKNDPDCDGGGAGGGGGTVIFSVAVVGDPDALFGENLWVPSCTAQSNSGTVNKPATTAIFPRHDLCAMLTTSTGATLTDDIIIHTITAKSGEITGVQLNGQDIIGEAGIAHESDVIPVDPPALPDAAGFTLHVHGADVALWKLDTHLVSRRSKRVEMIGTFSMDDMIYTPDP